MRNILPFLLLSAIPAGAQPAKAAQPIVVELFTSQGCSSCPPADALLAELAHSPNILALGFHVTYWDRLGWQDPYALPAATARQRDYRAKFGLDYVYTPQIIVNGRLQAVGSDRPAVTAALNQARQAIGSEIPLTLTAEGNGLAVQAGSGPLRPEQATLLLIGFDPIHETPVHAGENTGRTLREANIVRSLQPVGTWSGTAIALHVARPPGTSVALLLQAPDGHLLGAASLR